MIARDPSRRAANTREWCVRTRTHGTLLALHATEALARTSPVRVNHVGPNLRSKSEIVCATRIAGGWIVGGVVGSRASRCCAATVLPRGEMDSSPPRRARSRARSITTRHPDAKRTGEDEDSHGLPAGRRPARAERCEGLRYFRFRGARWLSWGWLFSGGHVDEMSTVGIPGSRVVHHIGLAAMNAKTNCTPSPSPSRPSRRSALPSRGRCGVQASSCCSHLDEVASAERRMSGTRDTRPRHRVAQMSGRGPGCTVAPGPELVQGPPLSGACEKRVAGVVEARVREDRTVRLLGFEGVAKLKHDCSVPYPLAPKLTTSYWGSAPEPPRVGVSSFNRPPVRERAPEDPDFLFVARRRVGVQRMRYAQRVGRC